MIRVLIVYENVPESTAFYILEISPDDWNWLKRCQGHFVNECDNPADKECLTLSEWLEALTKKQMQRHMMAIMLEIPREENFVDPYVFYKRPDRNGLYLTTPPNVL